MIEETEIQRLAASGKILAELPKNSLIYPEGVKFSAWGERLALVYTTTSESVNVPDYRFNPEKITRLYIVYPTVFPDTAPIRATDKFIGEEPRISPGPEPLEMSQFRVGRYIADQREQLLGIFTKPEFYWVRVKVGELYPAEVEVLKEWLDCHGALDVGEFSMSAVQWRKALKKSFADLSGEFAQVLVKKLGCDPNNGTHAEAVWNEIKNNGVYALIRNQDFFKFIER